VRGDSADTPVDIEGPCQWPLGRGGGAPHVEVAVGPSASNLRPLPTSRKPAGPVTALDEPRARAAPMHLLGIGLCGLTVVDLLLLAARHELFKSAAVARR